MEKIIGRNNARTLFGIDKIPIDNHIRPYLDEQTPEDTFNFLNEYGKADLRLDRRNNDILSKTYNTLISNYNIFTFACSMNTF